MKKNLLLRVSVGEEAAFSSLFKLYNGRVYTAACAVTRSAQMAEELVQEVFISIWTNRQNLTSITDFEGWLFIITRNEAFRAMKRIARQQKLIKAVEAEMLQGDLNYGIEEDVCAGYDYQLILNNALACLSPRQQSVFLLIHGEGLSRKEVALQLKISPESVKTHFSRALKSIRSLFPGYQTRRINYSGRQSPSNAS